MKESIAAVEKRTTPRLKADYPVFIGDVQGRLVDFSESGLQLSFPKSMETKSGLLTMRLPESNHTVRVQPVWNSRIAEDGGNLYGARIIDQASDSSAILRKHVIAGHFESILRGQSEDIREKITAFAGDLEKYLGDLVRLSADVSAHAISEKEAVNKTVETSNWIVRQGERLKSEIDNKLLIEKIQKTFRSLVGSWAYKSQILKRGFDKPKGYPGDYRTLEVIYDFETFSPKNDIGYYFDRYFLTNPYADAVRNRKDTLREIVKETIKKSKGEVRILNIASGSCREIREMFENPCQELLDKPIEFACLDWDEDALEFSKTEMQKIVPSNVKLDMLKENVMNFAKDGSFFDRKGKYDLIYSIGLADYLPDRVIKRITTNVHYGLKPDGTFLIAHKDSEVAFSHLPPEWFCEWVFYPRNEREMRNLMEETRAGKVLDETLREASGQVFFISLKKE